MNERRDTMTGPRDATDPRDAPESSPQSSPQSRPARRPTVIDVAELAGVSRQTVTRAINDMPGINAATRERVLAAAKTLKYRPSRYGRGLVLGHEPTVGFVLNDFANPYYSALAASVIETASASGWSVVAADVGHSPAGVGAALRSIAAQVDAVIGYLRAPASEFDDVFGDLPVVELEGSMTTASRGVVAFDYGPGIRQAVDHLVSIGKRRIVMIDAGPSNGHDVPSAELRTLRGDPSTAARSTPPTAEPRGPAEASTLARPTARGREYMDAMAERGLEPTVFFGGQSVEGGIRSTRDVLAAVPSADAIIAFNDLVAFGVLKQLRSSGVPIPNGCAVIGIDGLAIGSVVTPELSTLALDLTDVGRIGFDLAVAMHAGRLPQSGPDVHRTVSHTLLLRESA